LRGIAKRITLRESLKCWQPALWNGQQRLTFGFRQAGAARV
jgi:hypothetical protein